MVLNTINEMFEFMRDIEDDYRAEIKGKNLSAFTRNKKSNPSSPTFTNVWTKRKDSAS